MWTDEEYRNLARSGTYLAEAFVEMLNEDRFKSVHPHIWLRVMGLIETWDIIHDR